jgi:hypothetical protein
MVEIDPRAAWFAIQRLEEKGNWALEIQAGRIRRYLGSDEPIQEEMPVAPIPVAKKIVRATKSNKRKSLTAASKTRVEEPTPEKSGLKAPRRSTRIPWGKITDVLIAMGLIALMAWLLVTIG